MPIVRQQPGATKAAAAAGTAIGQARRAEEDRARAEREQARAAAEAERKQARAAAEAMQKQAWQDEIKFAMQKRQVDWQRALDKERRQEDYQLAAEDRAVERGFAAADYTAQKSLERIEFGKDLDYQYKTQERQRKVGVIDAKIAGWKKQLEDDITKKDDPAYIRRLFELEQQKIEIETGIKAAKRDAMAELLSSLTRGGDTDPGVQAFVPNAPTNPLPSQYQEAINDKTGKKIISRDGGETWEEEEPPKVIPPADFGVFKRSNRPSAQMRRAREKKAAARGKE